MLLSILSFFAAAVPGVSPPSSHFFLMLGVSGALRSPLSGFLFGGASVFGRIVTSFGVPGALRSPHLITASVRRLYVSPCPVTANNGRYQAPWLVGSVPTCESVGLLHPSRTLERFKSR